MAPVALVTVAGTACGSSGSTTSAPTTSTTGTTSATTAAATVSTTNGALGTFLTNGNGRTLYLFEKDTGTTSTCTDACAVNWPPLLTRGAPQAAEQAQANKLGTTSRPDGTTQVTYAGHPLYFFVADTAPGDTKGEGVNAFGAAWYVVSPAGDKIQSAPASSSSSGGY